jgi:TRAP transporter TAXI family solute receptor
MKSTIRLLTLFVALSCLVFGYSQAKAAEKPVTLSIATLQTGSGWYVLGQAIGAELQKNLPKDFIINVLPYSGGEGNPRVVGQGKADVGLGYPFLMMMAMRAEDPYKEKVPNLRMLVSGLDSYYYLFSVAKSSSLKTFTELQDPAKRKIRLIMAQRGSTGMWFNQTVLRAYGVDFADITKAGGRVTMTSFADAIAQMKDGQADAFGHIATPGHPAWTELSTTMNLRFIPLTEDILQKMMDQYGLVKTTVSAGAFKGLDAPLVTVGWSSCLFTTDKLSEDLAYNITKTVCESKEALVAAYKGADVFEPAKAHQSQIPLHPGAVRYYKEKGYMQ